MTTVEKLELSWFVKRSDRHLSPSLAAFSGLVSPGIGPAIHGSVGSDVHSGIDEGGRSLMYALMGALGLGAAGAGIGGLAGRSLAKKQLFGLSKLKPVGQLAERNVAGAPDFQRVLNGATTMGGLLGGGAGAGVGYTGGGMLGAHSYAKEHNQNLDGGMLLKLKQRFGLH